MSTSEEDRMARMRNVGESDYAKHKIQPYDIWKEYNLCPWRADIIKRVLRTKPGQGKLDLEKIIHICEYMIEEGLYDED